MDILKNQNKNIKTLTDVDLRKLSKEDIKIKLIELGIDEDTICLSSRLHCKLLIYLECP